MINDRKTILLIFIILAIMGLVACNENPNPTVNEPVANEIDRPKAPSPYEDMKNPLSMSDADVSAGNEIFQKFCSTCHGKTGEGNGPASASLDPKPENLKETQGSLGDSYLFWRISEGGAMEPFTSGMPPWKSVLKEEQIWQVIAFIRSLE